MIDKLKILSDEFIRHAENKFKRYFFYENKLSNRFSIIKGGRGIGKTVFILQFIIENFKDGERDNVIYIPADHFLLGNLSLYEAAEEFYKNGGELICFDEIHKYANWAQELKSIYDTFPKLKIIVTGSSILEIRKGAFDLSRRAVNYDMTGMSLREFIELHYEIKFSAFNLQDITLQHKEIAENIFKVLENKNLKILKIFKEYLNYGYYPFYKEYNDTHLYMRVLEQNIHTTLESDLIAVHPTINGISIKKIKKLLSIISTSVPFTPDLKNLKTLTEVGDERTLKTYLKYLEDAGTIITLSGGGRGIREMEKPEKIYLNNTNLIYALRNFREPETGNIRETFFINIVSKDHNIKPVKSGDFLVDNQYTFEIGGKSKDFNQIKGIENSFLAIDDIECGVNNKIPLWLFGFLY